MEVKNDLERDLKLIKMHEPSSGFTSKVTAEALNQLRTEKEPIAWMPWIPRVCVGGLALVLITLAFIVIQNFSQQIITTNFILGLQVISFLGLGLFSYSLLDRLMKRIILGFN